MPRSKVSKKNEYYISKERYYELLHFCRQFPEWVKELNSMSYYPERYLETPATRKRRSKSDVETIALMHEDYQNKVDLVCQARHLAIMDFEWGSSSEAAICSDALQANVTEDISYDILTLYEPLPVSRDVFYKIRRAFFWYLSQLRN